MRRVIAGAFVSLDGVMQAPGGPEEDPTGGFKYGGWTVPYFDDTVGQAMHKTFSRPFDALSTPTEAELVRREKMKQEG